MKKALIVGIGCVLLTGCTDSNRAKNVLLKSGYSQIETTGWNAFSCGKDDTFATGFKALGPSGIPVTGTVCEGLFKGATVRID